MISIGQLTDWIIEHRSGEAFPYPKEKIISLLNRCIENKSMICITDKDTILGVVCYEVFEKCKTIHVHDVLTTSPLVAKRMLKYQLDKYPGYSLQGARKTKIVQYNINKVFNLI